MRNFFKIITTAIAFIFLALAPAHAGEKFNFGHNITASLECLDNLQVGPIQLVWERPQGNMGFCHGYITKETAKKIVAAVLNGQTRFLVPFQVKKAGKWKSKLMPVRVSLAYGITRAIMSPWDKKDVLQQSIAKAPAAKNVFRNPSRQAAAVKTANANGKTCRVIRCKVKFVVD
jgi:hypothetical protein